MTTRKAVLIGCGISGPLMALFLKKIGIEATIYEAQTRPRDDAGAFLGITPNGLNILNTIVLARCIRDLPSLEAAFAKFQSLRQNRVQKIVKEARKVGDNKTVPNKFQQFFRDLLLPFFVKMEAKKMDWVYAYKVNWDEKVCSRGYTKNEKTEPGRKLKLPNLQT